MTSFLQEHKRLSVILAIVLSLALLGIYLWALLQPGIWYEDTFLHKQGEGRYAGSAGYAEYDLHIEKTAEDTQIHFRVNDLVKDYRVLISGTAVKIFEQERQIFDGKIQNNGAYSYLTGADGEMLFSVQVSYSGVVKDPEDLLPDNQQLYSWAAGQREDTRGKPEMLIMIGIVVLLLTLDIAFPNLFFILKHRAAVDGGEPSDFYRAGQTVSRVVCVIAILVCVVMSFMH